ncbi:MAG: hypothetical protein IE931_05175 [Sphingobacteriales bacterium]|nr:hypothetical protein [Sphingobacteriales bacterium]
MKNLFKFGFFALAISLSVVACNSNKATEATDSTTTMSADSTAMDSTMTDSTAMDSTAMDSTAKM